jgi:hypothetical protein
MVQQKNGVRAGELIFSARVQKILTPSIISWVARYCCDPLPVVLPPPASNQVPDNLPRG